MARSKEQLHDVLSGEDWHRLRILGSEELEELSVIASGSNRFLASRAVFLAGLTGGAACREIILAAAKNRIATIRIAAAQAARSLEALDAVPLLQSLLESKDAGVRKCALESASHFAEEADLQDIVRRIRDHDQNTEMRKLARQLMKKRSGPTE